MIIQGLFIDSALLLQYTGVVGKEAVKYMYICAKFNLAQDSRGKLKGESVVLLSPRTCPGRPISRRRVRRLAPRCRRWCAASPKKSREALRVNEVGSGSWRSPVDVARVARLPPGILLVAEIVPRPQISGHNTTVLLSIL